MTSTDCYAPSAMAQQEPARSDFPPGDPWHAFGALVSGVAFYGLLGWLADRWLGTSFIVAIGIVLGAGLGVWMTWSRFKQPPDPTATQASKNDVTTQEKQ